MLRHSVEVLNKQPPGTVGVVVLQDGEGCTKPEVDFVERAPDPLPAPAPSAMMVMAGPSSSTGPSSSMKLAPIFRAPRLLAPPAPATPPSTTPTAVAMPLADSERVRGVLAASLAVQQERFERLGTMMDSLRAGSSSAPHQAAWMKLLVHAQMPVGIEQPLATLGVEQVACLQSGRILRPWPLSMLLSQITRFHFDLVTNPMLVTLMRAHGWTTPPCWLCGGETEYLGDSMTIEKGKPKGTVQGGVRLVLLPNGLFGPMTSGVSKCKAVACPCSKNGFDHVLILPRLPPSIQFLLKVHTRPHLSRARASPFTLTLNPHPHPHPHPHPLLRAAAVRSARG